MKKRWFQAYDMAQKVKDGLYGEVYQQLELSGFTYSLQNLQKELPQLRSMEYYSFLMYCISKNETAQKHKTICEVLLFTEAFFMPVDDLVYWHVMQSIKMFAHDKEMPMWVINIFENRASSPFSKDEMKLFADMVEQM